MVLTYVIKNSLYINLTNHCTNRCNFCIRDHGTGIFAQLKLEKEPTMDDVLAELRSQNLYKYNEIVSVNLPTRPSVSTQTDTLP